MLGRHHLLLSVATVAVVVAPLFVLSPAIVLLVLAGTAIGSLIPDADAPDAAIFYSEVRGLKGSTGESLNALAPVFPAFGYVTKYLIYKPSAIVYDELIFEEYDIEERHRGFLHSILGLVTATFITGLYLVVVLLLLGLLVFVPLAIFLVAYFVGTLLHLLEDSCTKTGIQWNYPFQDWEIRGNLTTTARRRDTMYQDGFLFVLGGSTVGLFLLSASIEPVLSIALSLGGFVLVVLLWLLFGRFVAGWRIVRP